MDKGYGTLYLVATPIGNLEDITYRAVRILSEADLVAAEDTRRTLKLLNHLQIKKPLISYHDNNRLSRADELVERLKNGENIALVSDAGMPAISDPGEELVSICIQEGIPVTVIPGCTAALSALVVSGLSTKRFAFEGFLDERYKTEPPLLIDASAIMGVVRARPQEPRAPIVVHLVNWQDNPHSFTIRINRQRFSQEALSRASFFTPGRSPQELSLKETGEAYVTLEVPSLNPWGILVLGAKSDQLSQ